MTFSNLQLNGSTTLQNFTAVNSTSSSATTTSFYASVLNAVTGTITNFTSNLATIFGLTATNSTTTNATTTNLVAFNAPIAPNFIATSTTAVSSLQQLLVNASTTLQNFTALNATTSNATTTSLAISSITGSTQCLHVNSNGTISGTGSDCGSGGGTVYVGVKFRAHLLSVRRRARSSLRLILRIKIFGPELQRRLSAV